MSQKGERGPGGQRGVKLVLSPWKIDIRSRPGSAFLQPLELTIAPSSTWLQGSFLPPVSCLFALSLFSSPPSGARLWSLPEQDKINNGEDSSGRCMEGASQRERRRERKETSLLLAVTVSYRCRCQPATTGVAFSQGKERGGRLGDR